MTEDEDVCRGCERDRSLWLFVYESPNRHSVDGSAASFSTWKHSNIMLTQSLRHVKFDVPAPGCEIGFVKTGSYGGPRAKM
jgi:hypothetical protein